MKTGRNDPCHCGSGKKYKKCCYKADQENSEQSYQEQQAKEAADKSAAKAKAADVAAGGKKAKPGETPDQKEFLGKSARKPVVKKSTTRVSRRSNKSS